MAEHLRPEEPGFVERHRTEVVVAAGLGAASLAAWGFVHYGKAIPLTTEEMLTEADHEAAAAILNEPQLEPPQRSALNHAAAIVLLHPGLQGGEIIDNLTGKFTKKSISSGLKYLRRHGLVQYVRPSLRRPDRPINYLPHDSLHWAAENPERYSELADACQALSDGTIGS